MIELGLRTLLLADAGVAALVSDDGGERRGVYVDDVPQGAELDYVLVTTLDEHHNNVLAGGSGAGPGALFTADMDVDCLSTTAAAAKTLAAAVLAVLEDHTGAAGDVTVEAVIFEARRSDVEKPTSGEGWHLHRETLNLTVQYPPRLKEQTTWR